MSSKECEEQLESLVEAWQLNEADLNQTDIDAMKHLLLENQMQQDKIIELKIQVSSREEVANKYKEVIEEVREWLKYKAETLDEFDIPKRKETGAFWFSTRGEIDNLLQILDKGESNE